MHFVKPSSLMAFLPVIFLSSFTFADNDNTDILTGYYVGIASGYSFSRQENVDPAGTTNIAAPYQSFDDNIGNSMIYSAKVGYRPNDLFALDLSYNYRPNYQYNKNFAPDVNVQPTGRNRRANLSSQSAIASGYLFANGLNSLDLGAFDPYIGAGLGYAWNKMGNETSTNLASQSSEIIAGSLTHSLAWQMMLGSQVSLNKTLALDLGYRYANLGNFNSSTRQISPSNQSVSKLQIKNATANEVYLGMNYYF